MSVFLHHDGACILITVVDVIEKQAILICTLVYRRVPCRCHSNVQCVGDPSKVVEVTNEAAELKD